VKDFYSRVVPVACPVLAVIVVAAFLGVAGCGGGNTPGTGNGSPEIDDIVGTWLMHATSQTLDGAKVDTEGSGYSGWLSFHQDRSFEASITTPETEISLAGSWQWHEGEWLVTYSGPSALAEETYRMHDGEVYVAAYQGQDGTWAWFRPAAGCGGGEGATAIMWLSITPGDFAAQIGDVIRFYGFGESKSGDSRLVTEAIGWESSNTGVGVIDEFGEFTATGLGDTRVIATCGELPAQTTQVTVVAAGLQPTAPYYPMALGYWWEYSGSPVSPRGVRPQQDVTLTTICNRQVVAVGETWYELRVFGTDPQEPPSYMYLQHNNQGLQEIFSDDSTIYRLRAPIAPGEQWVDPVDPEHYFVIESVSETVTVFAGTYQNCVKVREHNITEDGEEWDILTWFGPNVGPVKSGYYVFDEPSQEQVWVGQELLRYDLGG